MRRAFRPTKSSARPRCRSRRSMPFARTAPPRTRQCRHVLIISRTCPRESSRRRNSASGLVLDAQDCESASLQSATAVVSEQNRPARSVCIFHSASSCLAWRTIVQLCRRMQWTHCSDCMGHVKYAQHHGSVGSALCSDGRHFLAVRDRPDVWLPELSVIVYKMRMYRFTEALVARGSGGANVGAHSKQRRGASDGLCSCELCSRSQAVQVPYRRRCPTAAGVAH